MSRRSGLPTSRDSRLGLWGEHATADLRSVRVNSSGAYGTFHWLDRERGIQGVLLIVDNISRTIGRTLPIRELVERVVDNGAPAAHGS